MRTGTPNLVILTVEFGNNITGTAIDADILVNFAVANTDVNQRLFVPEAQLVVTGKFRLGKQPATIGIWISSVVAIVSIPAPIEAPAEAKSLVEPETVAAAVEDVAPTPTQPARSRSVPFGESQTRAQKAAATRAANKAKATSKAKASTAPC
jgi:hypothetical protein